MLKSRKTNKVEEAIRIQCLWYLKDRTFKLPDAGRIGKSWMVETLFHICRECTRQSIWKGTGNYGETDYPLVEVLAVAANLAKEISDYNEAQIEAFRVALFNMDNPYEERLS